MTDIFNGGGRKIVYTNPQYVPGEAYEFMFKRDYWTAPHLCYRCFRCGSGSGEITMVSDRDSHNAFHNQMRDLRLSDEDRTPVERWEVTTPPDVYFTDDNFDDESWRF